MWHTDKKLPAKIAKIDRHRALYLQYLLPLVGRLPSRTDILGIMDTIVWKFPDFKESPSFGGMHKTIEGFMIGRPVTLEMVTSLSKVLAGNEPDMMIGKIVSPETVYSGKEYILAKITDCFVKYIKDSKDTKYIVIFELFTTGHAGRVFKTSITRKQLDKLNALVGLKGKWEEKRLHHREVVGSYLFINPCTNQEWEFVSDWAITSTLKGRNRKLFKSRQIRERTCMYAFEFPCFLCPVGGHPKYHHRCPISTHQEHFEKAVCKNCEEEGLVDPYSRSGWCLDCQNFIWGGT